MYIPQDNARPRAVLTVSELTAQIRLLLEGTFDQIAVVGEVSNAKIHSSGHWYFSLKDKDATLPCACFRNANSSIKFELEDGLQVVARGKLSVYPPRGAYQMIVTSLEPVGVGEWQLAYEQLRKKLEGEGLLDAERKRQIPLLPRKIGVVTSLAGAALRDILTALRRRNRNVSVVISPARVQGEGSAEEVAQALDALSQVADVEVILVARGGGSIEDLWSFNTETVARAVARARVPVISGVGHETDWTICDLVADLRAPTPTAAAELVAKGHAELVERWTSLKGRLIAGIEHRLLASRRRLERLSPLYHLNLYGQRLLHLTHRLDNISSTLNRRLAELLRRSRQRFESCRGKLLALGPLNVLNRGFAILRKQDGRLIRQTADVCPGEQLEALLSKGKLIVRVESIDDSWF